MSAIPLTVRRRTRCLRCDRRLPADAEAAMCGHGCTFCLPCTEELGAVCPNCSGELVRRPPVRA
jgi:uncharacterized protein